ncbi:hypothetical protein K439DRAFT_1624257 [Ramaria rubella]|nr:hypothetical protein K439DRAFT_1624257 [Ramaria rubella]
MQQPCHNWAPATPTEKGGITVYMDLLHHIYHLFVPRRQDNLQPSQQRQNPPPDFGKGIYPVGPHPPGLLPGYDIQGFPFGYFPHPGHNDTDCSHKDALQATSAVSQPVAPLPSHPHTPQAAHIPAMTTGLKQTRFSDMPTGGKSSSSETPESPPPSSNPVPETSEWDGWPDGTWSHLYSLDEFNALPHLPVHWATITL